MAKSGKRIIIIDVKVKGFLGEPLDWLDVSSGFAAIAGGVLDRLVGNVLLELESLSS